MISEIIMLEMFTRLSNINLCLYLLICVFRNTEALLLNISFKKNLPKHKLLIRNLEGNLVNELSFKYNKLYLAKVCVCYYRYNH